MLTSTDLNHEWTFSQRNGGPELWHSAHVPGHVHADLVREGIIGDPFVRMQEAGCQWVDEADWSYRTTFSWTPDPELPEAVLRFEGLDTVCSISLNGAEIGRSDNMHTSLEISVREKLRPGKNELRVDFDSARRVGRDLKTAYFAKEGIAADASNFFDRSFVRKAQYMYGWDWGPQLVSCGIWKPVRLIEFKSRIMDVWVKQHTDPSTGHTIVTIASEIEGTGEISHRVIDPNGEVIGLMAGDGKITVIDPELWDTGIAPALYTVESWLIGAAQADDAQEVYDLRETTFGIRSVELVRKPDAHGESFEFWLNGSRIWARGANWIPDHSLPSTITKDQLRVSISAMKELNGNMLRVWGGGLYESDDFYDLCDELGILVWQDFAFGCAYYPDDEAAQQAARGEAEQNIKRLRNHPSLALWCGNNENQTMWDSGWGGLERRPDRLHGDRIYHEVIPSVLKEMDPGRGYIPSSPWGGEHANQGGIGDQHCWDVWHGGDWPRYANSTARFCSEFGFIASPSLKAWTACTEPKDRDPQSAVVRWHDKSGKGYDRYMELVEIHYPKCGTLQDLVYYTQLNQRDALRYGIEHYRRSEFCAGTLFWQLNDCWPVQSWAVVDCENVLKAAGFEVQRLYEDVMLSIEVVAGVAHVWVANDAEEPLDDAVQLLGISTLDGTHSVLAEAEIWLEPTERKLVLSVPVESVPLASTLFVAQALQIARTWRMSCEPKDIACGQAEVASAWRGDSIVLKCGSVPLVDLWVFDPSGESNATPNFVTLLPGETIELEFDQKPKQLKARCLGGEIKLTQP